VTALVEAKALSLPGRLFNVDLQLGAGQLVCLVGPNGSGKTSLLHALAGIGAPSGQVTIDGIDPGSVGPAGRPALLTFLPASRDLRWPLVARDLIALGGGHWLAEEFELEPLLDRRVDRLSTGERSRVLLARALAPRPKLLLLDEPSANLDPLWQIRLMDILRSELNGSGRAALVAIHDLDTAARHADRILVMDCGRIAAEGLDGSHVAQIFGVERLGGQWRAAVIPPEDRRSSP
jgi:iron complex transport system ATP-binding protein